MKDKKFNKHRFAQRILFLPFVIGIIFVAHNLFVINRIFHFIIYGGEYINFEENERRTINEIFEMLKDIKETRKTTQP